MNEGDSELDTLVENIVRTLDAEDSKVYSKEVIQEFKNPSNVGSIADADGIGVADGLCHDTMEITLKTDGDTITQCMFFTDGCGATIACGSRLTRMVAGMTVDEAMSIESERLVDLLGGLPADHRHCASLAVIALRNALRDRARRRQATTRGADP